MRKFLSTVLILSMALITITGLCACGKETTPSPSPSSTEVAEVAEQTEVSTDTTEETKEGLPWTELGSLETHEELRDAVEKFCEFTYADNGDKYGPLYVDENKEVNQNNTFLNATGNFHFIKSTGSDSDEWKKVLEAINNEYTDIEEGQEMAVIYNDYFELLPDMEETDKFNGNMALTRGQAMVLVMRAVTPVSESGKPEGNKEFTEAVGESIYTDYAAAMDKYAYINTSNGLNSETFNEPMTNAEYFYMITKMMFVDDYTGRIANASEEDKREIDTTLEREEIHDGGDITFEEALANVDGGLPSDMYDVLKTAINVNTIRKDEEFIWNDNITKANALIKLAKSCNDLNIYYGVLCCKSGKIIPTSNSEDTTAEEALYWDNVYVQDMLESVSPEVIQAWAEEQGADGLGGGWLEYYQGEAAGTETSYAINVRTGERIEAGTDTYFYGKSMDEKGALQFFGSNIVMPGEEFCEAQKNFMDYVNNLPD